MRGIKKFLCLLLVLFVTGCNSYNVNMSISNNRQMDFSLYILSNDVTNVDYMLNDVKNKLGDTFEVNLYSEGDSNGISIFKHYEDIDYISLAERTEEFNLLSFYTNGYDKEFESKMFNLDKMVDTNRYSANFYVDLSEVLSSMDNVSVVFNLTVPNGTLSNNANSVSDDGNFLTWNLTNLGKNEIDFVFEITSYDSLYQLGALLIAVFLIFMIFTKLLSKSGDVHGSKDELVKEYDADIRVANLTRNAIKSKNGNSNWGSNNVSNNSNNSNNVVSDNVNNNNNNGSSDFEWFNIPVINNNVNSNSNINNNSNDNNNNNIVANLNNNNVNSNNNLTFNDISNSLNNNTGEEVIKLNNKNIVVSKKKDDE